MASVSKVFKQALLHHRAKVVALGAAFLSCKITEIPRKALYVVKLNDIVAGEGRMCHMPSDAQFQDKTTRCSLPLPMLQVLSPELPNPKPAQEPHEMPKSRIAGSGDS